MANTREDEFRGLIKSLLDDLGTDLWDNHPQANKLRRILYLMEETESEIKALEYRVVNLTKAL